MKRIWLIRAVVASLIVSPALPGAAQQDSDWIDPSPHSTAFVTVADGVRLEVLDWGGTGRPVLLLAGLPDTAHVFDDFAPTLTERHRVYAMTRRGFPKSSAPELGYDFDRLAEDVHAVIDALHLEKPIVVGHSFAGDEMHVLGSRHASEVGGLVYVDAAFNRADASADYVAKLRELPRDPVPQASDLRSIATLRDFGTRNGTPSFPEAAIRNRFVVDREGNIISPWQPAPAVREAYSRVMRGTTSGYNPTPIRVPALAIYATPERQEDLMRPWYDRNDPAIQRTVQELVVLAQERYRRHAEWFRAFAQGSRVVAMSGDHHLFVTNAADVRREIEAFASSLD